MARLLPSRSAEHEDPEPRVIGVDDEVAADLLSAMSSTTARRLLAALHEEPAAASELADRVDTSLQNVQYHLENLQDAGAIEPADTVYSEKGREMTVYAPADRPLVVVAGAEEEGGDLRSALVDLLGAVGLLGILSVLVQALVDGVSFPFAQAGGAGGGDGGMTAMEATPTPAPSPGGGIPLDFLTEPGVLFLAGGLAVLLVAVALGRVRG